jgi:hypothetical protein
MSLLTALGLGAQAVGLFAKPGNGLSAMLNAQYQLMTLIVDQLKRIQLQLSDINEKIGKLPADFEKISRNQYARTLIQEIAGAAGNYAILLEAAKTDPKVFDSVEVKRQLESIMNQAASRRSTLSLGSEGAGPEAGFVLPVACAVEIAALQRLGFPVAVTASTLKAYDEWASRILGIGAGSIENFVKASQEEHDKTISKAAEIVWAKDALSVETFKLAGTNDRTSGDQFCVIMSKQPGLQGPMYSDFEGAMARTVLFFHHGSAWIETGGISTSLNEELGVRLLAYEDSYSLSYWAKETGPRSAEIVGFLPRKEPWCYFDGPYSPIPENKDAVRDAARKSPAYKRFLVERSVLEALLQTANVERGKIGFALKSRLCCLDAQAEIRRMLGVIAQ